VDWQLFELLKALGLVQLCMQQQQQQQQQRLGRSQHSSAPATTAEP
jgi:hypothetical protein